MNFDSNKVPPWLWQKGSDYVVEWLRNRKQHTESVELIASEAFYLAGCHAVLLVASLANTTNRADTAVNWTLELPVFPSVWYADAPSPQRMNPQQPPSDLHGEVSWWWPPTVRVNADDFVRGTLFFPACDLLTEEWPAHPLDTTLTVQMLRSGIFGTPIRLYNLRYLHESLAVSAD